MGRLFRGSRRISSPEADSTFPATEKKNGKRRASFSSFLTRLLKNKNLKTERTPEDDANWLDIPKQNNEKFSSLLPLSPTVTAVSSSPSDGETESVDSDNSTLVPSQNDFFSPSNQSIEAKKETGTPSTPEVFSSTFTNNVSSKTSASSETTLATPSWLSLPIRDEKLWYVYGKAYDLHSFVVNHPGGQWAINLGQGRDCTGMFESYHPFVTTHYTILKKYEITSDLAAKHSFNLKNALQKYCIPHHSKDNFDNDGLYATLKERVKKGLEEHGVNSRHPKANWKWWTWYAVTMSTFFLLYPFYIRGYTFALFGMALTAWCLTGIGHDGSHFSTSKNATINFIMSHCIQLIASPLIWYHQHVYAHHSHTNDFDNDPDLHHFKPLRTHPLRKWEAFHIRQYLTPGVWFTWGFGAFGNALYLPAKMLITHNISGTTDIPLKVQHYFWQFGLFFVYIYYMFIMPSYYLPGSSNSFLEAANQSQNENIEANIPTTSNMKYWWPIAYIYLTGLVYGFITQISHIHDLGVNASFDKEKNSWAKNQILTSWNYCLGQNPWLYFTFGLNSQIEHHLFPGVNPCHYHILQPIIKNTCEEFGVDYVAHPTFGAIVMACMKHYHVLAEPEILQENDVNTKFNNAFWSAGKSFNKIITYDNKFDILKGTYNNLLVEKELKEATSKKKD